MHSGGHSLEAQGIEGQHIDCCACPKFYRNIILSKTKSFRSAILFSDSPISTFLQAAPLLTSKTSTQFFSTWSLRQLGRVLSSYRRGLSSHGKFCLRSVCGGCGIFLTVFCFPFDSGWVIVDPLISIFVSGLILGTVFPLVKSTASVLLQTTPQTIQGSIEQGLHEVCVLFNGH